MKMRISGCVIGLCGLLAVGCGSSTPASNSVAPLPPEGDQDRLSDPVVPDTASAPDPHEPVTIAGHGAGDDTPPIGDAPAVPTDPAQPPEDEAPAGPETPQPAAGVVAMVTFEPIGDTARKKKPAKASDEGAKDTAEGGDGAVTAPLPELVLADGEIGKMRLAQDGDVVTMNGVFRDLPPGKHGIHILAGGDCKVRKPLHFNPTRSRHGPPSAAKRHAGDYGNLDVAKDGSATFTMETDSVRLAGTDSIVGKAFAVTSRRDNGKSQPTGNSGRVIACGVIELQE